MKSLFVLVLSAILLLSCKKDIEGCTDPSALNYNQNVTIDDGSCDLRTLIPDQNFEQYLIDEGYDDVMDGKVLNSNINNIWQLVIGNKSIQDLSGIENFSALEELFCHNNQLTNLDLSCNSSLKILHCYNNQLVNINLNENNSLRILECYGNQLTSLDLKDHDALEILRCQNNQLTCLNVKNGNNQIITFFKANYNPGLSCIEVDDPAYSTTNWSYVDAGLTYSVDCNYSNGCF